MDKLQELYDMGFIEKEEYEQRKSALLEEEKKKEQKKSKEGENKEGESELKQTNVPVTAFNELPAESELEKFVNVSLLPTDKVIVFQLKEESVYQTQPLEPNILLKDILSIFERKTGHLKGISQSNANLIFDDLNKQVPAGLYLFQFSPLRLFHSSQSSTPQLKESQFVIELPEYKRSNIFTDNMGKGPIMLRSDDHNFLPNIKLFNSDDNSLTPFAKMSRGPVRTTLEPGSYNPIFLKYSSFCGQTGSLSSNSKPKLIQQSDFSYNKSASMVHFCIRLRQIELAYHTKNKQQLYPTNLEELYTVKTDCKLLDKLQQCIDQNKCYLTGKKAAPKSFLCDELNDQVIVDFFYELTSKKENVETNNNNNVEEQNKNTKQNYDELYYIPLSSRFTDEHANWIHQFRKREKFGYIDFNSNLQSTTENKTINVIIDQLKNQQK